jgi:hypothetical protein
LSMGLPSAWGISPSSGSVLLPSCTAVLRLACFSPSSPLLSSLRARVAHRPETLRYADRVLTLSGHGIGESECSDDNSVWQIPLRNADLPTT